VKQTLATASSYDWLVKPSSQEDLQNILTWDLQKQLLLYTPAGARKPREMVTPGLEKDAANNAGSATSASMGTLAPTMEYIGIHTI